MIPVTVTVTGPVGDRTATVSPTSTPRRSASLGPTDISRGVRGARPSRSV
jgi:hypothetical protein